MTRNFTDKLSNTVYSLRLAIRRRRQIVIAALITGLVAAYAAWNFAAIAWNRPLAPEMIDSEAVTSAPEPSPALKPSQSGEQVEVSVVTLRPQGFDPKEITRTEGRLILVVNDRTGLDEVSLNIDRQGGSRLRNIQVERKRKTWGDIIELTPGEYLITEAGHPDWTCRITVTSKQ
jgi:hypothetical protein